jgi:hypothetical protein
VFVPKADTLRSCIADRHFLLRPVTARSFERPVMRAGALTRARPEDNLPIAYLRLLARLLGLSPVQIPMLPCSTTVNHLKDAGIHSSPDCSHLSYDPSTVLVQARHAPTSIVARFRINNPPPPAAIPVPMPSRYEPAEMQRGTARLIHMLQMPIRQGLEPLAPVAMLAEMMPIRAH